MYSNGADGMPTYFSIVTYVEWEAPAATSIREKKKYYQQIFSYFFFWNCWVNEFNIRQHIKSGAQKFCLCSKICAVWTSLDLHVRSTTLCDLFHLRRKREQGFSRDEVSLSASKKKADRLLFVWQCDGPAAFYSCEKQKCAAIDCSEKLILSWNCDRFGSIQKWHRENRTREKNKTKQLSQNGVVFEYNDSVSEKSWIFV